MRLLFFALVVSAVGVACAVSRGAVAAPNDIARGEYLVTRVGLCSDCHGAKLQGAFLGFMRPGMPVAYRAPKIAGLPQLTTAQAIRFLETGKLPNGKYARPPMPAFRLTPQDAAAVGAYLKSLK